MGCGMTVPNAVPPSERPSVENHPIVPWNVPPVPVAAKRTKHAANPQCSIGTTTGRNASCFALNFMPFRSTCPPREWNGGTVSRARILTKAATAGRSFPATRWRAARERRAGERQQKRASKHLFGGIRVLTFKTASTRCLRLTAQRAASPIGEALRLTALRPWLLPVAFCVAGSKRKAINRVWRSSVPLADAWRNAKFARCIDRRPTKDQGWGAGGGKTAASSCWSGVFCFSRPFPKNLDRGLAT
jgi:hypothetical protein